MDLSRLKTTRSIANLKQGRNDWYKIVRNQMDSSRTTVLLYDEIGWFGITAQDFINDLKNVTGPIDLHVNSPGGEVWDGIAINSFLACRGDVTVYVDSLAASIASVIAMAGTEIVMGRNASMMIHDGFGLCIGNAADMREQADLLERVSDNIASIYADRTGKPVADWRAAMLAETWYIGQEAVDAGLADRVGNAADATATASKKEQQSEGEPAQKMAATFDLSIFRNAPSSLVGARNQTEPPAPEPTPPDPAPEPTAPPPTTEPAGSEAPADTTDRGFVVPETEPATDPAAKPAPEQLPDPAPAPDDPATQESPEAPKNIVITWDTMPFGEELLAQLRMDVRGALAGREQQPLGMESMPLLNKAIAVHHTDTDDTPWDGPAAVAAMPAEYADLHYCHAWQSAEADDSSHAAGDDDADDKKSSFKFPHHAKDGGPANLAACRNGLARLENSKIPDADKPGVKAHLQAHLDDANGDSESSSNHAHTEIAAVWDPSMTAAFKEAMQ